MSSLVTSGLVGRVSGAWTSGRLSDVARTYERSAAPVWIHDISGACIYRNAAARRDVNGSIPFEAGEVLDAQDRVIGYLRTLIL